MSKAIAGVAIGAAIIGLAVATGGISLAPTLTIAGSTAGVAGAVITTSAITIAGGLATTALGAIALSIGASMAISGISSALMSPKVPSTQVDRLNLQSDPKAFRKTVLGSTSFPLDVRYQEWNGSDQDISDLIVTCAGHKVESFDEIWINDEQAWVAGSGAVGKYVGYFFADWINEGGPGHGFDLPGGRWSADAHRLTGCAYGHFRFKTTGTTKKATSPFSSGVPSRMTVIGKGGMMYDPRRDSTVPGGSGPMRADDQSTWRYFAADGPELGSNLPLAILRVMLGWRIANPSTGGTKLSVGSGLPKKRLHLESFITAANIADELVTKTAGGTEPRFSGAITCSEGDEPQQVIDALCAACNGRIVEIGGKLGLVIAHNDLAAAATDPGLNDDDVVGDFVWNPDPALDQCPNVVSGNYTDPSSNSLYQQIPYPEARIDSVDGIDRILSLDLTAVESSTQAERISSQVLQRKQYDRTFTATFDIRAWQYGQGDVVPFTYAPLSFDRQLCRVVDQEYTQDSRCAMTLRIEHSAIYAWDGGNGALVQPAAPNVYDRRNSAIIQGIDEAGTTAAWSLVLDDNGARPEDNATVGAPAGTLVAGVLAELVAAKVATVDQIFAGLSNTSAINIAKAALTDSAAEQMLVNLLLDEKAVRGAHGAIAAARQEITQKAVEGELVEARSRIALAIRTATAEAAIVTEQSARETADGAIAATVTSAVARLNNAGGAGETVEAAFISTRQAAVELVGGEATARTDALEAAMSTVGENLAAAVTSITTEAGETYATATSLETLSARVNNADGFDNTLEAVVSSLRSVNATQDGKLSARFQEVAAIGGVYAGVRAVVEESGGDITSDLALVAQAIGFWLQIDEDSFIRALGLELVDGEPVAMFYGKLLANSIETEMLQTRSIKVGNVDFGTTGEASIYYYEPYNDNNQTTWGSGPAGVGVIPMVGSPIKGQFSAICRPAPGSSAGQWHFRVCRINDGTVVWGGDDGVAIQINDGTPVSIQFFDSAPSGTREQYDIQILSPSGQTIRTTQRSLWIEEVSRHHFSEIHIVAPEGEGPGANASGGQVNGSTDGGEAGDESTSGDQGSGLGKYNQLP